VACWILLLELEEDWLLELDDKLELELLDELLDD
jgi:hypothetical protein